MADPVSDAASRIPACPHSPPPPGRVFGDIATRAPYTLHDAFGAHGVRRTCPGCCRWRSDRCRAWPCASACRRRCTRTTAAGAPSWHRCATRAQQGAVRAQRGAGGRDGRRAAGRGRGARRRRLPHSRAMASSTCRRRWPPARPTAWPSIRCGPRSSAVAGPFPRPGGGIGAGRAGGSPSSRAMPGPRHSSAFRPPPDRGRPTRGAAAPPVAPASTPDRPPCRHPNPPPARTR